MPCSEISLTVSKDIQTTIEFYNCKTNQLTTTQENFSNLQLNFDYSIGQLGRINKLMSREDTRLAKQD